MSCVEGAVVAQVPGPNQYWEHIKSKDRAYFIGRDPDGMMVFQCEGDAVEVGNLDWSGWRHIPGCTGWDWEPEEYPQYWTPRNTIDYLYVVVESPTVWKAVTKAGTIEDWTHRVFNNVNRTRLTEQEALALLDNAEPVPAETWPKYYICNIHSPGYYRCDSEYEVWHIATNATEKQKTPASTLRNKAIWTEVTEAEAKARVAKPAEPAIEVQFLPVAPEMDWVVQDRVPARNHVDEWCWCKRGSSPGHFYYGFGGWSGTIMHGHVEGDEVLHLRCRRKDLPPVPAPVEETFPQWYILKESEIRSWVPRWAIKRTGEETSIRYVMDGVEVLQSREPWTGGCDAWECCTATEAYDRLGTGILPPEPADKRRVPVKLWVTYRLNDEGGDWPVRATQADQTCQNWKEIKFDGNGAFIEVES